MSPPLSPAALPIRRRRRSRSSPRPHLRRAAFDSSVHAAAPSGPLPHAELLARFASDGVDYAVVAGLGLAPPGLESLALDLWLVLEPSAANLDRAFGILAGLGYGPATGRPDPDEARLRLASAARPFEDVVVDLAPAVTWPDLAAQRTLHARGGLDVPVAAPTHVRLTR